MFGLLFKLAKKVRPQNDLKEFESSVAGRKVVYIVRRHSPFLNRLIQTTINLLQLPAGEVRGLRSFYGEDCVTFLRERYHSDLLARFELCSKMGEVIVPLSLLAGFGPRPWIRSMPLSVDTRLSPISDIWRALVYCILRRELSLFIGPTIIPTGEESPKHLFLKTSRALYIHERTLRGSPELLDGSLEDKILFHPAVEHKLSELAIPAGLSRDLSISRAKSTLLEIAGSLEAWAIALMKVVLRNTVPRLFPVVEIEGLEKLRGILNRGAVVLLPNHRSHFDYLLISNSLFNHGLPLPMIAAGNNLNFFPAGRVLKATGAFFIRRKIENDPIYKFILERYLTYLATSDCLIEFYIEGGRSRTGLPLKPKIGLLKYLLRGFATEGTKQLSFVPISITYHRVPEEQSLVRELLGEAKIAESFVKLLGVTRKLRTKIGSVRIVIGDSITISPQNSTPSPSFIDELSREISKRVGDNFGWSLTSSIATLLLAAKNRQLTLPQCFKEITELHQALTISTGVNSALPELRDIINHGRGELARALSELAKSELIEFDSERIMLAKSPLAELRLEFNRNLILCSLFELAINTSPLGDNPSAHGLTTARLKILHSIFSRVLPLKDFDSWFAHIEPQQKATSKLLSDLKAARPPSRRAIGPWIESIISVIGTLTAGPDNELPTSEILRRAEYEENHSTSTIFPESTSSWRVRFSLEWLNKTGILTEELNGPASEDSIVRVKAEPNVINELMVELRELLSWSVSSIE